MLPESQSQEIVLLIELWLIELGLRVDVVTVNLGLELHSAAAVASLEAFSQVHRLISAWGVGWRKEDFITKDTSVAVALVFDLLLFLILLQPQILDAVEAE